MNQPTLLPTLTYDFQYPSIVDTFLLERNRNNIRSKRLLFGIGVFLIPTFIMNAIFDTYVDLKGMGLVLATSIVGLMLLNITIYLLNQIKKGNKTLIFGYQNIKILEDAQLIHTISLQELKVTRLNYETAKGNYQPAIQISTKELPCMTIGCKKATKHWKNIEGAVDSTAFLVQSEEEWNKLLNVLENFIEKK